MRWGVFALSESGKRGEDDTQARDRQTGSLSAPAHRVELHYSLIKKEYNSTHFDSSCGLVYIDSDEQGRSGKERQGREFPRRLASLT